VRLPTHAAAAARRETKCDVDVEHLGEDGDAEENDRPE
jgi:hypothetical protein